MLAAALLLLPLQQELPFKDVNDFCVLVSDVDLQKAGESKYDLFVLDHSRDHPQGSTYVPADYDGLRKSAGGPKLVLAYLAVGVAQSSRFYWKKEWNDVAPAWLGAKDPNRRVAFNVKFWEPAWQDIIRGNKDAYLDRLLAAGFDGIVVDGVDAYNYWNGQGVRDARNKMVEWVDAISSYARKQNPKFLVIPISGEDLLSDGRFVGAIQGFIHANVYLANGQKRTEEQWKKSEENLDRAVKEGKKVFVVEITEAKAEADHVFARCKEKGYVAYCAPSGFNRVATVEGHEPD